MDSVVDRARAVVADGTADGLVLAWRAGEDIHAVAAGRRGPAGAPLEPDTPFPVASITKPATAALVHALAARGRLDLDAPVLDDASMHRLLRHAGGVGPDWPFTPFEGLGSTDAIERLGAPWSYGNPGYWLSGDLAARAAGATFAAALREHVLEPAGMRHARAEPWADDPTALAHDDPDPARSYYLGLAPERIPSGGLRATAADVLAFAAACWPDGALGDLGMLEQRVPAYGGREWGAGWETWTAADGTLVAGHSGVLGGIRTRLWSVPARRSAVVVLAVGPESEDAVLDLALRAVEALTGLREPSPPAGPPPADLAAYAGTYVRRSARLEVEVDGGSLRVASWDVDPGGGAARAAGEVVARPVGGDAFLVGGTSAPRRHVEFLRDGAGSVAFARVGLVAARRAAADQRGGSRSRTA